MAAWPGHHQSGLGLRRKARSVGMKSALLDISSVEVVGSQAGRDAAWTSWVGT